MANAEWRATGVTVEVQATEGMFLRQIAAEGEIPDGPLAGKSFTIATNVAGGDLILTIDGEPTHYVLSTRAFATAVLNHLAAQASQ